MNISSLGYRTDLMLLARDAVVSDRGDHILVETPSARAHWWGNFILFQDSPTERDLARWMALFDASFGRVAGVKHVAFGWDGTDRDAGVIALFGDSGFTVVQGDVLTARTVECPQRCNEDVSVHPLEGDDEWSAAIELQIECNDLYEPAVYRSFKEKQMRRYRDATEAGRARWYGAFAGSRLVADLGVYVEQGLGRVLSVETHPDFRRRGICGRLVHESASDALDKLDVETLVLIVDPYGPAGRVYRSVGFRFAESQFGVLRPPPRG